MSNTKPFRNTTAAAVIRCSSQITDLAATHGTDAALLTLRLCRLDDAAATEVHVLALQLRILSRHHGDEALVEAIRKASATLNLEDDIDQEPTPDQPTAALNDATRAALQRLAATETSDHLRNVARLILAQHTTAAPSGAAAEEEDDIERERRTR